MFPAGVISGIVGLLAFCASAALGPSHVGPGKPEEFLFAAALLNGLMNPLFFIGFPLGLYWCIRGKGTAGGVLRPKLFDRNCPRMDVR
jgi:hypothetical protein